MQRLQAVQARLLSAPKAMKMLKGEGPDAVFGSGYYSGLTLAEVAKEDPPYLNFVFGAVKAKWVMTYLEKLDIRGM